MVRFKAPLDGETVVKDLVKGDVTFHNQELDDLIIQRTDGSPTYNFVVVIDDHEMKVTHVVRGDDHLNNTPKQQLLYEALGLPVPAFGHLPIILGDDGGKMSASRLNERGRLPREWLPPEALFNYLTRVGWACGDMEHFTAEEAIAVFGLDGVAKTGAGDMDKLTWLNQQDRGSEPRDFSRACAPYFEAIGVQTDDRLQAAAFAVQARAKTLVELAAAAAFYFTPDDGSPGTRPRPRSSSRPRPDRC